MQSSNSPKAIPYRPRRSMFNWVDFLVVVATLLVFGAVVAANNHRAHAETRSGGSEFVTANRVTPGNRPSALGPSKLSNSSIRFCSNNTRAGPKSCSDSGNRHAGIPCPARKAPTSPKAPKTMTAAG